MKIQIHSKGIDLQQKDTEYINERINHLADYAQRVKDESTMAQVHVSLDHAKSKAGHVSMEVTLHVPGVMIRAEVHATTVNEATDLAFEKLKRQVGKYKSKQHRRDKSGKWIPQSTLEEISEKGEVEHDEHQKIVKRKKVKDLNLMHEEEALHQMELLDHDFFVYKDLDSGHYHVVYRRHKGGYGMLELE